MDRILYLIGLNHRSAELATRECFALSDPARTSCGLLALDDDISEMLCLSTCNRVEIMAVGNSADTPRRAIAQWAKACGEEPSVLEPHVYVHAGRAAVEHVFSVAASLDSLVLGEPQILGQLKDAYRKAVEDNTAKLILNRLMHKAFMTAKRVRTETAVASSAVSVSYAAVELAKRIFNNLSGRSVLLIGAGEMAELAAAHLSRQGAKVQVTNRTHERAVVLAGNFGGNALPFEALLEHLAQSDIVISSTGAQEPIITAADMRGVMKRRKNRPVFLIDIAVPRDVEAKVNDLDNVYLYNVDDLSEVVETNMASRRDEAVKARAIVQEEADRFQEWHASLGLHSTIGDIVQRSETIAREEFAKTLRRLGGVSPEVEAAVTDMLNAVVKKINHEPISFIKRRFAEEETGMRYVDLARRMFNLDNDTVPDTTHIGRKKH